MELNVFVASRLWAIASAAAVAGLGAYSLFGGAARPRGALPFGLFAMLWGVQIALSNIAALSTGEAVAQGLHLAALVCLVALPYFLIEFSASYAPSTSARWRFTRWGAIAAAALTTTLLVLRPEGFFQGVALDGERIYAIRGPLFVPLVEVPLFAAFGVALVALARATLAAPTPRTAVRAATLLAGLSLYVSFSATNNFVYYAIAAVRTGADVQTASYVALFLGLTLVVGLVTAWILTSARSTGDARDARRLRLLGLTLVVPAAFGAVEAFITWIPIALETIGLWRLVGVGIIAYGIARWRIYDLPQRVASMAATTSGVVAAAAGGAAAYGAGAFASSSPAVPVAAGLLVLGAALLPSVSFARRLFGIERAIAQPGLEQSLYGQRIDAYRAALEASMARGTLEEDQEFLAALRERFGISPPEERVLLHYAQSSVIVSRDRQAWETYERLRLLGEGGAGRTWLARDRSRDRLVVLKETLPSWQQEGAAREAVMREARLAAKVRHPNVVAIEEVVEAKGCPIIVMEYLEGGSLAEVLRARGTLPWPEARAIAVDVLRGLEAIHAGGIVHRDVKPSNVLLNGEGVAKVADFGIAVAQRGADVPAGALGAVAPSASGKTMVMDGAPAAAGTLAYMAPEAREGKADRRSDVYGVGALLHEMLYGAPPHVRSPIVVRKDLPPTLPAVLAKAIAPAADARYPTARALADELTRLGALS